MGQWLKYTGGETLGFKKQLVSVFFYYYYICLVNLQFFGESCSDYSTAGTVEEYNSEFSAQGSFSTSVKMHES